MSFDIWLNETLYPDWGQRFLIERVLDRVKSPYQDIAIVQTASHGRMMVLDGCVQITERDEFVYQEMLSHVPLLAHGDAKRVLIIGAGDGGVLRRVCCIILSIRPLWWRIDSEVIRLARLWLPTIGGPAWTDSRAQVLVGDGVDYVAKAADDSFDVIIVDSTDPFGVGEVLFTDAFYKDCARVLTGRGIVVNQCGVPFMQNAELSDTSARRRKFFPFVSAYVVAVPTYVGGLMALGIASRDATVVEHDAAEIQRRADKAGILGTSLYWTPQLHVGCFHLPPYIQNALDGRVG